MILEITGEDIATAAVQMAVAVRAVVAAVPWAVVDAWADTAEEPAVAEDVVLAADAAEEPAVPADVVLAADLEPEGAERAVAGDVASGLTTLVASKRTSHSSAAVWNMNLSH